MDIPYSTESSCSICYEAYDDSTGHDAFRLNCQHAFGRSCINSWAAKSTLCPLCRLDTFPAELSGGLNSFRRLANRTIFVADPPVSTLVGVGVGLGVGAVAVAVAVTIDAYVAGTFDITDDVAAACTLPSLVCAGIGLFRGITLGSDAQITCSYFLSASACLFLSSYIL
ncbi:RING finger domain-containing protein [Endozoicomonas ascidiicola]|uniref:RING finger domain-containing protein n=1 Tax=Endozoicomonas ascidiicola TaxID=1698521 RepID=UPI000A596518|nr:RING finger domain-containing protein [Endozoicomonas ascidiicola]